MTSTRSTLHSISTTPLTSPHAFVHVILIKIHFSLHFQSVFERIPIPITIPYHTVRPPKDLPDPCSLVCTCMYIRTTETNGSRYMYIKHVLSDNTLLNSPPGSFLLETKLSARYTCNLGKRLFWGGGVLNWWPRRIFLGMSGTLCMYAFIRISC